MLSKFIEDQFIEDGISYDPDVWRMAGERLQWPAWGEAARRVWEADQEKSRRGLDSDRESKVLGALFRLAVRRMEDLIGRKGRKRCEPCP